MAAQYSNCAHSTWRDIVAVASVGNMFGLLEVVGPEGCFGSTTVKGGNCVVQCA